MQNIYHVLTDNLNGPDARLNARFQEFITQNHPNSLLNTLYSTS